MLLALGACTPSEPSRVDERYSWDLAMHLQPEPPETAALLRTVDRVQIFEGPDREMAPKAFSRSQLLFETQSPSAINDLFVALRDQTRDACDWRRESVYHLFAFDHERARLAAFRIYRCVGPEVVAVLPVGNIGLFSTRSLSKFLSDSVARR